MNNQYNFQMKQKNNYYKINNKLINYNKITNKFKNRIIAIKIK